MLKIAHSNGCLVFRHYGVFEGDEFNRSLLDVIRRLSAEELEGLKYCIADCREVSEVSLHNTDRARFHFIKKNLAEVLQLKGTTIDEAMRRIGCAFVLSNSPDVAQIQKSRATRQGSEDLPLFPQFETMDEALTALDAQHLKLDELEYKSLGEMFPERRANDRKLLT